MSGESATLLKRYVWLSNLNSPAILVWLFQDTIIPALVFPHS